jgi:hypothetical protein
VAAIPATIYAVTTFIREKEHRVTGYILFVGIIVARLMDLLVNSPEQIIWNDVRVDLGYVVLFGISMLIRKPIGLYFFLDYASYSGINYQKAKEHYYRAPIIKYFYYFTVLLVCQNLFMAGLYTVLIKLYGIEGYNTIAIVTNIAGYLNIGMIVLFVFYIIRIIKKEDVHNGIES